MRCIAVAFPVEYRLVGLFLLFLSFFVTTGSLIAEKQNIDFLLFDAGFVGSFLTEAVFMVTGAMRGEVLKRFYRPR